MKKILLLGGSNCQKNALLRGKALGHEMIVADYSVAPAACGLLDRHVLVSTFDPEGCRKAAEQLEVDGIMTMGTDQPVLTAALVAEALNLPSTISVSLARAVTNKKIMKAILKSSGIPTVNYKIIDKGTHPDQWKDLLAPLVIKPLDSQGQRGVYKLESPEDVLSHLDKTLSYSREKEALLEEYYPSDEITVSGWIQESTLYILTVTDRILLKDSVNIGICTSHRFPTVHRDRYQEIKQISEDIVRNFDLKNGPLYIQMLIGEDGIKVNELACRLGGAFEDVIIPRISGFSILDAAINAALGLPVQVDGLEDFDCSRSTVVATVQLMFAKPGVIASITPLQELMDMENVLDAGYNFKPGDEIKTIEDATARFGHFVMVSESGSIEAGLEKFKECFQIVDEKGNNLFKVI